MKVSGKIIPGSQLARYNYPSLIAQIAIEFPSIAEYGAFGTINVLPEASINKSIGDYWTDPLNWIPAKGLGTSRNEAFGFRKMTFEFPEESNTEYSGWIVFPEYHRASHNDNSLVEVLLSTHVVGIAYGQSCTLVLDHIPSKPRPAWFGHRH